MAGGKKAGGKEADGKCCNVRGTIIESEGKSRWY